MIKVKNNPSVMEMLMKQLSLFADMVRTVRLVAPESPKRAFYSLRIESLNGQISLVKESGAKGRVLDRRCWPMKDLDYAVKMFERRIAAKTKQDRKSPRKYIIVEKDV